MSQLTRAIISSSPSVTPYKSPLYTHGRNSAQEKSSIPNDVNWSTVAWGMIRYIEAIHLTI